MITQTATISRTDVIFGTDTAEEGWCEEARRKEGVEERIGEMTSAEQKRKCVEEGRTKGDFSEN